MLTETFLVGGTLQGLRPSVILRDVRAIRLHSQNSTRSALLNAADWFLDFRSTLVARCLFPLLGISQGALDCLRKIIAEEGQSALFKGASANVLRTVGSALVLVMYDHFKTVMGLK